MVKKNDSVIGKIKKLKSTLKEEFKMNISKVILFGSYAKGNPRMNSDIDLAIISDDFKRRDRIKLTQFLLKIGQSIDINIEPLGFSEEEYKNCDKRTFLAEIKKHGVEY